ncbi:MAG: PKD domain-containing protein, partial [Sphingobacteriales bacterium]
EYTLAEDFTYPFPAAGNYVVRLVLIGGSSCNNDETQPDNYMDFPICIQNPPEARFNINGNTTAFTECTPLIFTPNAAASVIDNSCAPVTATWSVTGGTDFTILGGSTTSLTNPPQYRLNSAGVYNIRLSLKSVSCEESIFTIPVTVNDSPVADLPNDPITLCSDRTLVYNDNPASPLYANLEGTGTPDATTYTWTAELISGSGPLPTFTPSANEKYPTINFTGTGQFRIRVTHRNGCNMVGATSSQIVNVADAPTVTVAPQPNIYCPGDIVPVSATVTPGTYPGVWVSAGGGTFDDPTALSTNYHPTPAESTAGEAIISYKVTTALPTPCNEIESAPVTIQIVKPNPITSDLARTICSGQPFSYTITSTLAGSTFTWAIDPDPTATSPLASGYPTNGSSDIIAGTITNNNPAGAAVTVTYILTPNNTGCTGGSERLVLTIIPSNPLIDFTFSPADVCGPQIVTFTNLSPPENGTYEWNFDDGTTSTEYSPTHTFPASTTGQEITYNVTLKLISPPCGGFTPKEVPIPVSPAVPLPILQASQNTTCGPVVISMVNLSPGNNVSYFYELLNESRVPIGSRLTTDKIAPPPFDVTPNPERTITVYVRLTATDKCGTPATSAEQPFSISPTGLVGNMFINSPVGGQACVNQDVIFQNNSSGDVFNYNIYREGVFYERITNAPKGPSAPYKFTQDGNYTVTVQPGSLGCGLE